MSHFYHFNHRIRLKRRPKATWNAAQQKSGLNARYRIEIISAEHFQGGSHKSIGFCIVSSADSSRHDWKSETQSQRNCCVWLRCAHQLNNQKKVALKIYNNNSGQTTTATTPAHSFRWIKVFFWITAIFFFASSFLDVWNENYSDNYLYLHGKMPNSKGSKIV